MIDTLAIWTYFDPALGGPEINGSAKWTLSKEGRPRYLKIGNLRIWVSDNNQVRTEFDVPELLGVDSPAGVWRRFLAIPAALRRTFKGCWHDELPPFREWHVSRLDASFDFPIGHDVNVQDLLEQFERRDVPHFVPVTWGRRGSITVEWQTEGKGGQPAHRPDILKLYDKHNQMIKAGPSVSQEVLESFRGVLRFEYQVHAHHGALRRMAHRGPKEPVYLRDVLSPLRVHHLLKRGARILELDMVCPVRADALSLLRAKYENSRGLSFVKDRFKHYCWIRQCGEGSWRASHSSSTVTRVKADLKEACVWPVSRARIIQPLKLPFTPESAGEKWLLKLK